MMITLPCRWFSCSSWCLPVSNVVVMTESAASGHLLGRRPTPCVPALLLMEVHNTAPFGPESTDRVARKPKNTLTAAPTKSDPLGNFPIKAYSYVNPLCGGHFPLPSATPVSTESRTGQGGGEGINPKNT